MGDRQGFEFEDQPAFAGFRELATNGIDKPVLNVFRILGMLGGNQADEKGGGRPDGNLSATVWVATESSGALPLTEVLEHSVTGNDDVNVAATSNGHEVDVLLWNYHDADVPAPPAHVHLSLDGLQGTEVVAAEFRVDATHSNAYRLWQAMGSPAHPTAEQSQQLEKAGALEQNVHDHKVGVDDGRAAVDLTLPRQAVVLVRLRVQ